MTGFPQFARPLQRLVASGVSGIADPASWAAYQAILLGWEELFACTGLFGIELTSQAKDLAEAAVELRGFISPPLSQDADYFVLTRSPLPNCPFCAPSASWPDDIVVAHLRVPGVDLDDPMREVAVRGKLDLGEAPGPAPGLASHVRLRAAIWQPLTF